MACRLVVSLALTVVCAAAQPSPAFEVASVKITPKSSYGYTSFGPSGTNRYMIGNASLDFLVQVAYEVTFYQISGAEKLGDRHYDISAKAEDGVRLTPDQLQPRLRQLLEERFKLAAHREKREVDGFALVVAKGGPKLKPTSGSSENGVIYRGGLRLFNQTLDGLATFLRIPAGRPVVDKSGIAGSYDFELRYALDDDPAPTLPSVYTALQEQFGLKLEKSKVTIEMLVIDHVDQVPIEN